MTVFCVIGIRSGVPYEDPGASELLSVHDSREGAEARVAELAEPRAVPASNWPISALRCNGYDDAEIVEHEVLP